MADINILKEALKNINNYDQYMDYGSTLEIYSLLEQYEYLNNYEIYKKLVNIYIIRRNIHPILRSVWFKNSCYFNSIVNLIGACRLIHEYYLKNRTKYNWYGQYLTSVITEPFNVNTFNIECLKYAINGLNKIDSFGDTSSITESLVLNIKKSLKIPDTLLYVKSFTACDPAFNKYTGYSIECDITKTQPAEIWQNEYYDYIMEKYFNNLIKNNKTRPTYIMTLLEDTYNCYSYPKHIKNYSLVGMIAHKGIPREITYDNKISNKECCFKVGSNNVGFIYVDINKGELYTMVDLYNLHIRARIIEKKYDPTDNCITMYYYDVTSQLNVKTYEAKYGNKAIDITLKEAIRYGLVEECMNSTYMAYTCISDKTRSQKEVKCTDVRFTVYYVPNIIKNSRCRYYPKSNIHTDLYGKVLSVSHSYGPVKLSYIDDMGIYNCVYQEKFSYIDEYNQVHYNGLDRLAICNVIVSNVKRTVYVCETNTNIMGTHFINYFPEHETIIDNMYINREIIRSKKSKTDFFKEYIVDACLYTYTPGFLYRK